jgi:hypothetical protein
VLYHAPSVYVMKHKQEEINIYSDIRMNFTLLWWRETGSASARRTQREEGGSKEVYRTVWHCTYQQRREAGEEGEVPYFADIMIYMVHTLRFRDAVCHVSKFFFACTTVMHKILK